MIIDKYNRIIIEKLPKNVAAELEQIATDTDKFEDEELVEIYKDNFNDLFAIIEKKHPEALKPKAKLIKKAPEKKKIVKKAEPKKKIVKKSAKKSEPIGPTGKDIDLSMLVGKELEVYEEGVKEPKTKKITTAKVDDPKFSTRGVYINASKSQYEFPLSKLEAFLEGKEVTTKHSGDPVVIVLKNSSEIDCETAIAEVKAIHAKREAAAQKRADAPKKKVTTAAREKQIKTFISVFKTKEFKADKKQAEGFAKDIVAVYNKYGLKSMAEQLEKDIQELIDTKYKKAEK